uniref:Uncharacterized protein n=1 Tax=Bionectria ochroleuca TaxID=29856 RepID=A0A0B7KEK7_BIOOC
MGTKSETETVGRWTREVSTQLYQVENLTRRNPSVHQHGPSLPGIELMAYAKLSIWTWAIAWGFVCWRGFGHCFAIVSPDSVSFHIPYCQVVGPEERPTVAWNFCRPYMLKNMSRVLHH